ncbi:MAG: tetratricopeptide repeat protein, partial [Candidatus Wallbacteria bacterium]|nr:tetratricopeptide repeat protein [Candidatus Wallbacteria bacterium]
FMRLSLLRIPVRPEEIPGLPESMRKKTLGKFLDTFLLEHNQVGLIELHSLLKEHAARHLDDPRRSKLQLEIADFFFRKKSASITDLKEAYYHYQGSEEPEKSVDVLLRLCDELQLMGSESGNAMHLISGILQTSAQRPLGLSGCTAIEFVDGVLQTGNDYRTQELLRAKTELLIYQKKFSEAEKALKDISGKAVRSFLNARIVCESGTSEARATLESLLLGNPADREKYEILIRLAVICNSQGDFLYSTNYFQSLKTAKNLNSYPLLQAWFFREYAGFLAGWGDVVHGLESVRAAESIYREYSAMYPMALTIHIQACLLSDLQEYEKALELLARSSVIRRELKDYRGLATDHNIRGDIYFLQGKIKEAVREKQEGLTICHHCNLIYIQAVIHNSLGEIFTREGNWDEAETDFKTALDLLTRIDEPGLSSRAKLSYSQYLLIRGRTQEAHKILAELAGFAQNFQPRVLAGLYFFRSLIFGMEGNQSETDSCWSKYLESIGKLPVQAQEKLKSDFQWYADRISCRKSDCSFILLCNGSRKEIGEQEISEIRSRKNKYEFFSDFDLRELWIDGKEITFFNKRVLVPLLFLFASEPGMIFKPAEIFPKVWERKYDAETDGSTFRMTIARLRSALGDDERERFIRFSTDAGGYQFNDQTSYCVIFPHGHQIHQEKT